MARRQGGTRTEPDWAHRDTGFEVGLLRVTLAQLEEVEDVGGGKGGASLDRGPEMVVGRCAPCDMRAIRSTS